MELITTYFEQILIVTLVAINIFTFFVMANDKRKATYGRNRDTERTPEGFIFFLAVIFGSVGVYLGMLGFRHKTRIWYFQLGIPLLIIQNLATIYVVWGIVAQNSISF